MALQNLYPVSGVYLTRRQNNPEKRTMLPKMAFTGFASRYREPKIEEGFQDVTKIDFKVCRSFPMTRGSADNRLPSLRAQKSSGRCGGGTGYRDFVQVSRPWSRMTRA